MITLSKNSQTLELVLSSQVTAYAVNWETGYSTKSEFFPSDGNQGLVTGTTAVTMIKSVPVQNSEKNYYRSVNYISVYNADTESATATIRINDSGTYITIASFILASLYSMHYEHGDGWTVYSNTGIRSTAASSSATTSWTPANLSNLWGWWKSDEGITTSPSNSVLQWENLTGSGVDLTQSVDSKKPRSMNSNNFMF